MGRRLTGVVLFTAVSAVVLRAQIAPAAAPSVRVAGRIVSVMHEGVPAAEVWVTDAQGKVVGRAVADGDGVYQLPRVPFVALQLHARGGDKVEGSLAIGGTGFVREATLMLEDGEPLRGAVTLPDGGAAAGAAVLVACEVRFDPPFDWWAEVSADAQGRWSLPMAPLRPLVVRAFVAGRPLGETKVARGREGEVRVAIPTGSLKTRPVKVRGALAGNTVRAVCDLGMERRRDGYRLPSAATEAIVDGGGDAALWDLPIGYAVRIVAPGCHSMPISISCAPGTARELEFALTAITADELAPSTRMIGKLVDHIGAPLPGVTILSRYEASPERVTAATSAADGAFVIDVPVSEKVLCQFGLSSSAWRLGDARAQLGADGISWFTVPASVAHPLRLDAGPAGTVKATLCGPGGAPLAAARVELRPARGKTAVITATDAAGRLDVSGLPPGDYVLVAGGGIVPTGRVGVVVPEGGAAALDALEWAAVGEVRGVVTDGGGTPLPSLMLFAMVDQRQQRLPPALRARMIDQSGMPILTDRRGQYRIPCATEGSWVVVPRAGGNGQGATPRQVTVTVEARKVATVDVTADG